MERGGKFSGEGINTPLSRKTGKIFNTKITVSSLRPDI